MAQTPPQAEIHGMQTPATAYDCDAERAARAAEGGKNNKLNTPCSTLYKLVMKGLETDLK